jgi:hypothetical protein
MVGLQHMLSVDPGATSAWVFWARSGAGVWSPTRVDRGPAPDVREARRLLGALLPDWSAAALVVEDQFYIDHRVAQRRGCQSSPWQDVARLIEARCRWQHAAELAGAGLVEVVTPGRWIPAMTRGAPGADSKARIAGVVERLLPGVPLRSDERDAALLGCWWVQERGGVVRVRGREAGVGEGGRG